jgi:hypothetical protein
MKLELILNDRLVELVELLAKEFYESYKESYNGNFWLRRTRKATTKAEGVKISNV